MKLLIICSTHFYDKLADIKKYLEKEEIEVVVPNEFGEVEPTLATEEEYKAFYKEMYYMSRNKIKNVDAVLVLNFTKKGITNYIGASTFLEMYEAFMNDKKIFIFNGYPEIMLKEEIIGFDPIIINGNLDLIIKSKES